MKGKAVKRKNVNGKCNVTVRSAGALLLTVLFLTACGTEDRIDSADGLAMSDTVEETDIHVSKSANEEAQNTEEAETTELPEAAEPWTDLTPRPIDFPFPYFMEEYTLSLVPLRDEPGQYALRLCGEYGTIVQQFSCGALTEPVTYQYDDLYYDYYEDLEIFSEGSSIGLLFPFDPNGDGFIEEAIEIPRYEDVDGPNIMVREEDEDYVDKTMYQLNMEQKRMEEIGRWHLEKDTGMLEIWNSIEQRTVFEGQTELDENWEPVNMKYYGYLFWNARYLLGSFSEQDMIPVWISEPREEMGEREESGFEYVQYAVWGNSGYTAEYVDRRSLLEEYGFSGKEPDYESFDERGDLRLELYVDELSGTACGFAHDYCYTYDLEKREYIYGFTIDSILERDWEEPDPFNMKSVDGTDGANQVEAYEERLDYREDGQPDYFESQGYIEWLRDKDEEYKDTLLQISYIYRDDGTLYYRGYRHNSYVFSTTFCNLNSYYDERGRVSCEDGYITHGAYYYYYFYEDDGKKPKYCLALDDNLEYHIPVMIRFR